MALLSTRGNSLEYLGTQDQAVVMPIVSLVLHSLTDGNGTNLMLEERWILLLSIPRWLLAPHPPGKTPAETLRARATDFLAGKFAELWHAHRWENKLPTIAAHARTEGQSDAKRLEATIEFMKLAAKQRRLGQGAARMTDVPKVAPSIEAYGKLSKLLGFDILHDSPLAANDKRTHVWRQRGFDKPEHAAADLVEWLTDEDNKKELVKKWRPRLAAARNKKQPAGTGLRTEHFKPFFDVLEWQFCVLFEAIERFAIPNGIARIAATVLATMLLKRLDNGTPHISAGLRPIGMGEALFKEAWRARSSWAAKTLGSAIFHFGQMAVGLKSGGEGVSTMLQVYCDAPSLEHRTVIVAFDYSNAYSTTLLDPIVQAGAEIIDWLDAMDEATRKRLDIKSIEECKAAARCAIDDIVFLRTHYGEVLTVVDGQLKRVKTPIGLTQGGLFSMLQFCLAVCMRVFKPLKEKYPEFYPKAIADDTHLPAVIRKPEDIERLAEWCHKYVELSKVELNLSANPRKFKILQHRKWIGTEIDIAKHLELFPAQIHEGKLKRPMLTHGALKVNGVAIGYDKEARAEIIHAQVRAHELKLKTLEALRPSLGAQTTELYGRFALKPSTVFNHQARGNEPSITREPLERAAESQARLFRAITKTSPEEIRDVQHDANSDGPTLRRCEEALHLSQRHGGVGWSHPRLIAAGASSGRVTDVIYLIRRSEDVSALVPAPELWLTSGIPMLIETAEFVQYLVKHSKGFADGPQGDQEKDGWKYIKSKLVELNGDLIWKGLELISSRHAQHVFNEAMQQDMHSAIVNDPSVHPATRAHFRATTQLGSGMVLSIDLIDNTTELSDEAWMHEMQGYINHPKGAISLATRCTGFENHACTYHATKLTGTPPCPIGAGLTPRTLTVYEHMNGTHFDGCGYGGGLAVGHTALNDLVKRIATACGAAARVAEVRLGPKDPSRPMHPITNKNQKADGLFSNWTTSTSTTVWDGTIVTAVTFHRAIINRLANGTTSATDLAEATKIRLKAKAAQACTYEFLPWAVSSRGGMGSAAADVFTKAFAEKLARTEHEGDKWRIRNERKRFLQQLSAIVARRNWAIFSNAWPRRGGEAPAAPPAAFD